MLVYTRYLVAPQSDSEPANKIYAWYNMMAIVGL
jgi:hypothetical protein